MQILKINSLTAGLGRTSSATNNRTFKGVNDVDPSKKKYEEGYAGWYGFNARLYTTKEYNSNGQMLREEEIADSSGGYYIRKLNEYKYYDNGNIKSKKKYASGLLAANKYDCYDLIEYNPDGTVFKELTRSGENIDETFYNIGGIAKKVVKKPCSLYDRSKQIPNSYVINMKEYHTVELFFKKVTDALPYRILGKNSWGKILREIKDKATISRIQFYR